MDYKAFWMYYRAVIVSIIASIADMSSMYGLNKIDNLSEPIVIGLSSLIGLFIQFFGQKYWTFKNNTKSHNELMRQVLLFFGLEITIIVCVILIYEKIYDQVEKKVKELTKGHKKNIITKYLFENKDGKMELSQLGKIMLKNILVFFTFNIISYPLWKYFIFAKK
jgi:putative flippase GtrA